MKLNPETNRPTEGNALIYKAHVISLEAFPFDFDFNNDELLWGYLDNRPVLRTFAAIGIEYMKERQYQKAINKFEQLMKLNSRDNQGVRYLIPECFLFLKKYDQLLKFLLTLEDDSALEYLFAKVVAYYKVEDFENAKLALKEAKLKHPFVTEELIKNKHEFPADEFDRPLNGVPMGSRQEAFLYWERTTELWSKDEDLLQFISRN
ncbi:tetratricopeptide repeat protein [Niabella aquatica]